MEDLKEQKRVRPLTGLLADWEYLHEPKDGSWLSPTQGGSRLA